MNKKNLFKIFQLLMILIVCILLVAFTTENTGVNYYKTSYDYKEQISYVIESKEDLEKFVKNEEMLEKYDEEYFNEKQLVLVIVPVESTDISINVNDYSINNGIMNIDCNKFEPSISNCEMGNHNILIEVDKVEINEININI